MQPHDEAIDRLRTATSQLEALIGALSAGGGTREELDRVLAEITGAQHQLFGPKVRARRGQGARKRILDYLLDNPIADPKVREEQGVCGLGLTVYKVEQAAADSSAPRRTLTLLLEAKVRAKVSVRLGDTEAERPRFRGLSSSGGRI